MKQLKVAVSAGLEDVFESIHEQVPVKGADWMEVSAVVLSSEDLRAGKLEEVQSLHLGIPVFAVSDDPSQLPVGQLYGVMDTNPTNKAFYGRQVDNAAQSMKNSYCRLSSAVLKSMFKRATFSLTARGTRGARSFAVTRQAALSTISSVSPFSVPTFVMPTSPWAIC